MDFKYGPEEEAFRKEVQEWLRENLPADWTVDEESADDAEAAYQISVAWQKKLHTKGWAAPNWPNEWGGGGLSLMQTVVLDEELAKAKAPTIANNMALGFAGPTILAAGTEEQKRRFIPKMISCDEIWCQGFSEPNAGSDLASLQTRAVRDGDDYVVNGQKVWSTLAHHADWQGLLVRTDPDAPKHRGITYLLVDMHTPGIEVRPLRQINGRAGFNEVFYENVRVPCANVVGHENRGWYVAMTNLSFERTVTARGIGLKEQIAELIRLATTTMRHGHPAIEDPAIRQQLAQCAIECQTEVLNSYRILSSRIKGQVPGSEAQRGKVFANELAQRLTELATKILGTDVLLDGGSHENLRWRRAFVTAKSGTIAGGTSEVVRNIIGERVLGLPKG